MSGIKKQSEIVTFMRLHAILLKGKKWIKEKADDILEFIHNTLFMTHFNVKYLSMLIEKQTLNRSNKFENPLYMIDYIIHK